MFAISAPLARTLPASPLGGPLNVSVGIENPQNLPPGFHDIGFYDVDIRAALVPRSRRHRNEKLGERSRSPRRGRARKTGERPDRTTGGQWEVRMRLPVTIPFLCTAFVVLAQQVQAPRGIEAACPLRRQPQQRGR